MPKPDTVIEPQVLPKPELEKRTRRIFSAEYKLSILEQANVLSVISTGSTTTPSRETSKASISR